MSDGTNDGTTVPAKTRLDVIDVWRGLVVALMALDHVKDFLGFFSGMEMPARPRFDFDGNLIWWFSRFVTHYCAPSFVFLAGASVVLFAASRRARGVREAWISAHLLLRGALLVVLEFTVVAWGWGGHGGLFAVIACLGALLALGAVLRFVPGALAFVLGVVTMFAHPWLARETVNLGLLGTDWHSILFRPNFNSDPHVLYPVVPWLAPFLLGIGFGKALLFQRASALRRLLPLGLVFLALWLTLRLTDGFAALLQSWGVERIDRLGNLTPHQPRRGWLDFFWMSKYPPAADYLLWTLGGMFVLAAALQVRGAASSRWLWPLRVFGRAPLFFYCTHLFLYRGLAQCGLFGRDFLHVYLAWLLGLALLLGPCWAFGRLKQRYRVFPLDLF